MPKRNEALTLYLDVWSDRDNIPSPIFTAGDVRVSKDGGAFAASTNLPTIEPAGSDIAKLVLTAAEMDADIVMISVLDRSADPLDELFGIIYTSASTVDEVATAVGDLNNITATDVWSAGTRTLTAGTKDAEVDAIKARTDNLPNSPASTGDVNTARDVVQADIAALNDITVADILAGTVEGSYTLQQAMRIMLAVLAGKSSGGGTTTITFRDTGDSANRIVATVDSNGNRSEVTIDAD